MKQLISLTFISLLVTLILTSPVQAGEPTGVIGPMNPTMFKCTTKDGKTEIQPDPWRKPTIRIYVEGGGIIELEMIEDFLAENPDARQKICTNHEDIDFGFDTKDAEEFRAYMRDLKEECDEEEGIIVPITDTRIEGFVYEFHPVDQSNPSESEWFSVPSRIVPVRAKGITFEIFWNSDDNGSFYFNHLGAGPIVLDLMLPPDAHAINPSVFIDSTGLQETWTVFMGFYRGDVPPPNVFELKTPDGNFLPFTGLGEIEILSMCGYDDLPGIVDQLLMAYSPPDTTEEELENLFDLPDVGGTLPQKESKGILIVASILLILLPAMGLWKMKRH